MGDGSPRMLKEPSSLSGEWLAIHAESGGAESRATRKREGVLGQLVSKLVVCMELWFLLLASPLPEMPNNQGSWGVEALPQGAFSPLDPVLWAVSRWEGSLALPHLQFLPSTLALSLPT